MCRVLNMSEFWIFLNFRVCQVSAYASIAQGSEYAWIWLNNALLQGSEHAWSMFHMIFNKPQVLNIPGLRKWQGCEYARVTQGAEYAWTSLNMPRWICLNNAEYDWIFRHIPEKPECWICQNSECVWYST